MNQSILVVDDDPVVRDIVREYLQGRGFSVTALEHGIALQRALENERPEHPEKEGPPGHRHRLTLRPPTTLGVSLAVV